MVDFSKFKDNSAETTARRAEATRKLAEKTSYEDDDSRFWKPTVDKVAKTGGATIRFLPYSNDALFQYVDWWEHSFKNDSNNKWYIERSLTKSTTREKNEQDSIGNLNQRLWKTGSKVNQDIARKQKRNHKFVANILVVADPANPDAEGKVFLFKYGPAINDFVEKALNPKPHPITKKVPPSLDAFDIFNGANFDLLINVTDNGWNYDESGFGPVEALSDNEAVLTSISEQIMDLAEFIDDKHYKDNEKLDKRLVEVLGRTIAGLPVLENSDDFPTQESSKPVPEEKSYQHKETPASSSPVKESAEIPTGSGTTKDDDFFNSLMENDVPF